MKRTFFSILSFVFIVCFLAYNADAQKKGNSKSVKDVVVAKVGTESVTFGELERAYQKNLARTGGKIYEANSDSLNDFINLYLNYKLKVADAVSRGFDNDNSVKNEIDQNRRVLAENFFYDNLIVEPEVEKMLNMRKREFQFAIIVFNLATPKSPTQPPDTVEAYKKAHACMDLINSGVPFEQVAKDSSDDKTSANNGGIIKHFITSGTINRAVEKVIYSLKPGKIYPEVISLPHYGYYIVKLVKDEPRLKVKASHILITPLAERDSIGAKAKADSIYKLLKKGADFAKLAEENSEDPSSKNNGGRMDEWYSRATGFAKTQKNLVPEFEEALFNLKDGEISKPIATEYGYHIIRRDSSLEINKEDEREDIKKLYKRIYYEKDKITALDSIKNSYGFKINYNSVNALTTVVDTNRTNLDSTWASRIPDGLLAQDLFTLKSHTTKVKDWVEKLNSKVPEYRGIALNKSGIVKSINTMANPVAFDLATENLENESSDFKYLMKEFKDGILLFKVEAMEVWDKLKFDSTLAKIYWDSTKTRYKTEPTYEVSEIYTLSDSTANDIYSKIQSGDITFDSAATAYTQRSGYREKHGYWGRIPLSKGKLAKLLADQNITKPQILAPVKYENGYSIIQLKKYETARMKTFNEAISDFAPEYQDLVQKNLTNIWLKKLKKQFKAEIDAKALKQALKEAKKNEL